MSYIIKPSLALFLIASIVAAALSFVHRVTLEPIAENHARMRESAMKEVLPAASVFEGVDAPFDGSVTGAYRGVTDGETVGYVIELAPEGYSGKIHMMAGIIKEGNALSGVRVVRQSETPGLGALAANEEFYLQFDGKGPFPLTVIKTSPAGESEIHALTGATVTTMAITNAVNEAYEWYLRYSE